MGTFTRSVSLIVASAGSAAVLAVSGAPTAGAANQALMLNGLAAGNLTQIVMAGILHGAYVDYNRVAVPWPEQAKPYTGKDSLSLGDSVAIGVANLKPAVNTALAATGPDEHVTIVGLSAGSLVADQYLRDLVKSGGTLPDKSKLNFVVIADGNRKWLNTSDGHYNKTLDYTFLSPPETQYDTTVVVGEYDGWADFPDRKLNFIADANALLGAIVVHIPVMFADLSTVPAANITSITNSLGGVTTNYLVPTTTLPLVTVFPFLKSQEAALKKIVDAGYKRNDPVNGESVASVKATASAVAASAPEPTTVPQVSLPTQADTSAPTTSVASVVKASTPAPRVVVNRAAEAIANAVKSGSSHAANSDTPRPAAAARAASRAAAASSK